MATHDFAQKNVPLDTLATEIPLVYLALGTRNAAYQERVTVGPPWEVFAYQADDAHAWHINQASTFALIHGIYSPPTEGPAYFRVTRHEGVVVASALQPGIPNDTGFERVQKRLDPRFPGCILNDPRASAFVTRAQLERLV